MKRVIGVVVLLWGLTTGAIIWAQEGHAITNDSAYLADLDRHGITYPDDQYAIDAGHETCRVYPDYLREYGVTAHDEIVDDIMGASPLDSYRAGALVDASIKFYCPNMKNGRVSGGNLGGIIKS